jgi:hypothetical protein
LGSRRENHRSKRAARSVFGVLAAFALATCARGDATRSVTMYVPQACPADGTAYVEFHALGDYDPAPVAEGHRLGNVGETLAEIGASARALVVQANEGGRAWMGRTSLLPTGDVRSLLLPSLSACALTGSVDQRAGARLTPISASRVLVAGGAGDPTPRTFVLDLTDGSSAPVATGLLVQRARSSVTPFGAGALVAGGVSDDGSVLTTAEVFDPALGGFDQQRPVQLGGARADHGAVVTTTGQTLLVGGVGADSKTPLSSMEIVDPVSRTVRTENVARLAVARRDPTAILLASGEILVAGGLDANGDPVPALEWFAPDASGSTKRTRNLVTGPAPAFAALGAGGAIAVIGGAPGAPPGFQNVWVIDADGALEAAAPVEGSLTAPALFGSAGGAPVLWTGDRWLRWQPWDGAFGALPVSDDPPARIGMAATSPDPGLALWIATDNPSLAALRFDTRGPYSPVANPLLVSDTSDVAPDRLPAAGVIGFEPSLGLVLGPGASAFVTDRTYADVAVDLDAPTGEPALVVLRDDWGSELEVGGAACPGPVDPSSAHVHVVRRGPTVAWTTPGASGTCATGVRPAARVSIGVRCPSSVARAVSRNLRVARLSPTH